MNFSQLFIELISQQWGKYLQFSQNKIYQDPKHFVINLFTCSWSYISQTVFVELTSQVVWFVSFLPNVGGSIRVLQESGVKPKTNKHQLSSEHWAICSVFKFDSRLILCLLKIETFKRLQKLCELHNSNSLELTVFHVTRKTSLAKFDQISDHI